jgi:hypothetical protein
MVMVAGEAREVPWMCMAPCGRGCRLYGVVVGAGSRGPGLSYGCVIVSLSVACLRVVAAGPAPSPSPRAWHS